MSNAEKKPQVKIKFTKEELFVISQAVQMDDQQKPINYDDFFISIPKIKAEAQIFPHIPVDKKEEYLPVLQKGVAHARGSAFPGMGKTIYLFAHSTNLPLNVVRYNAVFFLLNQLKTDDSIVLTFNGQQYSYRVFDQRTVAADETIADALSRIAIKNEQRRKETASED